MKMASWRDSEETGAGGEGGARAGTFTRVAKYSAIFPVFSVKT